MSSWSRSLRAMAILALATAGAAALALIRLAGDPTPQALGATALHAHAATKVVSVSVREWRVTPSTRAVPAGVTTFVVTNRGRKAHEFLVVPARGSNPKAFPLRRGTDRAVLPPIAARIPPIAPGATARITVDLKAGRWVLMCNIAGHYRRAKVPLIRASAEHVHPVSAPGAAAPLQVGPTIKAQTTLQLGTSGIMKFDKASLTAPEGKVTIVLTNKEVLPHNVGIKGGGVDVKSPDAGQGKTASVAVDLVPGTYTFYCAVPGHEGAGMKGTLRITAGAAAPGTAPAPADPLPPDPGTGGGTGGGSGGGTGGGSGGTGGGTPAPPSANQSITVDGLFTFSQTTLYAPPGAVTISLTNNTPLTHNIGIKGTGVDVVGPDVAQGGTSTVTATLAEGTYTFYCAVPGHEASGMTGTLVVSNSTPGGSGGGTGGGTGGGGTGGGGGGGGTGGGTPPPPTPPPAASPEQTITVSGLFSFSATTLQAPPGPVTLHLVNQTALTHNIGIKGNGISVVGPDVGQGGTSTVTVTLPAGTYTFFCAVPGHEGAGMTGTLIVSSAPVVTPPPPPPAPKTGIDLFRANCGGCHTLAAAGTSGKVGPNLDDKHPDYGKVIEMMTKGKKPMPSFKGVLTSAQFDLIATFVSQSVRR